jgi:DnaK suppressor protein
MAMVAGRILEVPRLNQRQLKWFEELLTSRRQELLQEAGRTVSGMNELKENFPEPADRAALESERNATLRIRDRERKLLSKIEEALERIEGGTYGVCEECGEAIGVERLKARPVTTLCIDCKADQEADERQRRGWDD